MIMSKKRRKIRIQQHSHAMGAGLCTVVRYVDFFVIFRTYFRDNLEAVTVFRYMYNFSRYGYSQFNTADSSAAHGLFVPGRPVNSLQPGQGLLV